MVGVVSLSWHKTMAGFFLLVVLVEQANGWGPYMHAAFGSLKLETEASSVAPSSFRRRYGQNGTGILQAVFVTANAFPDAFKATRDWMHTVEFAAFQTTFLE